MLDFFIFYRLTWVGCITAYPHNYSFSSVNATDEARLVVQALRVNTLSKLTFADSKRFDALVKDIFPGVDFKGVEYAELADAFREAAKESNLIAMETQVRLSIKCGARTEAPIV